MGTVPVEIKQGKVTYSKIEMHDLAHRLENFDLVSSKIIFHSRFPLSRQFRLTRQTGFPMYRKKKKKHSCQSNLVELLIVGCGTPGFSILQCSQMLGWKLVQEPDLR